MRNFLLLSLAVLAGCAGRQELIKPQTYETTNERVVAKAKDTLWNDSVAKLGKRFFVINNLDKDSGLINLSYTGDPEKYVDCGRIISYVKNARGERTYDFPGSKAQMSYEVMADGQLGFFQRSMSLEGRVNLIFEKVTATSTRVTANTRYILTRKSNQFSDTISFNSGERASFPPNAKGESLECVPTGKLEEELLSATE